MATLQFDLDDITLPFTPDDESGTIHDDDILDLDAEPVQEIANEQNTSPRAPPLLPTPFENPSCPVLLTVIPLTTFYDTYYKNDRKNIQGFPICPLFGEYTKCRLASSASTAQPSGNNSSYGSLTVTTPSGSESGNSDSSNENLHPRGHSCVSSVDAIVTVNTATLIGHSGSLSSGIPYSQSDIKALARFQCYDSLMNHGEFCNLIPGMSKIASKEFDSLMKECVKGEIVHWHGDNIQADIKFQPDPWKYEQKLQKKKKDHPESQQYALEILVFTWRGNEGVYLLIGKCASTPFYIHNTKTLTRILKRNEGTKERIKRERDDGDEENQDANTKRGWFGFPKFREVFLQSPTPDSEGKQSPTQAPPSTIAEESIPSSDKPGGVEIQIESNTIVVVQQQQQHHQAPQSRVRPCRISVAFLLWLPPFGWFGAHHFYLGKRDWAVVNLCSVGVLFVSWAFDMMMLPAYVLEQNQKQMDADPTQNDLDIQQFRLLWSVLGICGGHHFALGNWPLGVLYLVTFGLFLIGWVFDGLNLDSILQNHKSKRAGSRGSNPGHGDRRQESGSSSGREGNASSSLEMIAIPIAQSNPD